MEEEPKNNHDSDNSCKRPCRGFSQSSILPSLCPFHLTGSNPQNTNQISFWVLNISKIQQNIRDTARFGDGFFVFLVPSCLYIYSSFFSSSSTGNEMFWCRHQWQPWRASFTDLKSTHQKLSYACGVTNQLGTWGPNIWHLHHPSTRHYCVCSSLNVPLSFTFLAGLAQLPKTK